MQLSFLSKMEVMKLEKQMSVKFGLLQNWHRYQQKTIANNLPFLIIDIRIPWRHNEKYFYQINDFTGGRI